MDVGTPYCPACDYNLTGVAHERCPECGESLCFLREGGQSLIPWERRATLGWLRAYWATVWLVIREPGRFAAAIQMPVSFPCANRFRWITAGHAFLGALFVLGGIHAFAPHFLGNLVDEFGWRGSGVMLGMLFLTIAACGAAPSYLFHPNWLSLARQNRAVALSYYASAPLALMPMMAAFLPVSALCGAPKSFWASSFAAAVSMMLIGLIVVFWLILIRLTRQCLFSTPAAALVAVATPILWLAVMIVLLVVVPLLWYYLEVIFLSLR